MGAHPNSPGGNVALLECLAQPKDRMTDGRTISKQTIEKPKPIIVVAGDDSALNTVRTLHSPTKSTTTWSTPAFPQVRVWTRKLRYSGWTGPADTVFTWTALFASMHIYTLYLRWHEHRTDIPGFAVLADPVLPRFEAVDCSTLLAYSVYGSIAMSIYFSSSRPDNMLEMIQTHIVVVWTRMLALYVTPLEVPLGSIPLVDAVAHPDGAVLMRDLFFSGHTAATMLVFFGTWKLANTKWRLFFGSMALATMIMVLLQKTHYVIDVLAAPCVVHTSRSIVVTVRRMVGQMWNKPKTHTKFKSH